MSQPKLSNKYNNTERKLMGFIMFSSVKKNTMKWDILDSVLPVCRSSECWFISVQEHVIECLCGI